MKTISVREAAAALGISTRAVLYRREKGHLKGVLTKNNGVDEYRIYPNKEIIEGLRRIGSPLLADAEFTREDERPNRAETATIEHPQIDTLAARVQELEAALKRTGVENIDNESLQEMEGLQIIETIDVETDLSNSEDLNKRDFQSVESSAIDHSRMNANVVVEALWDSLISKYQEKLEQKDQEIGTVRAELADKDRQLKLLPDFEKQKADLLKRIEEEHTAAQIQFERAKEKEAEAKALEEENETLRRKAEEAASLAADLQALKSTVEELKRPLWKKWFLAKPDKT